MPAIPIPTQSRHKSGCGLACRCRAWPSECLRVHSVTYSTNRIALHTQKSLRAGVAWWRAGVSNSARAAAAARSTGFGFLWSRDPARAAYEAALSGRNSST